MRLVTTEESAATVAVAEKPEAAAISEAKLTLTTLKKRCHVI